MNCCVAPDGGMYMPVSIPVIPRAFFNNIGDMDLRDIAYIVATAFFGDEIAASTLKNIVDESFNFDAPMRQFDKDTYILELFHGPTLTFKDYGARFMARLMCALDKSAIKRNVLVATTGNTGAAAANGLYRLKDITVSVLYPRGQLSNVQKHQLTALGENIYPIEIAGSIEDCKALIQKAITDPKLSSYNLTGANSINVARLIPQISFSLYAYSQLRSLEHKNADKAIYYIPSGNLSNVVATAMAKHMGMPCGKIVGATAINNQLSPLLSGTPTAPHQPQHSLAPSIDMAIPSGWPRLLQLYKGNLAAMQQDINAGAFINDATIGETINHLREKYGYTLDPHGAVAYATAMTQESNSCPKIVFATGHPAKQLDIMTHLTGSAIEMPLQLTKFMTVKRSPIIIPPTLPALRKHLNSIN